MAVTYDVKRMVPNKVRGKWKVMLKQPDGKWVQADPSYFCAHNGHDSEDAAMACWREFLSKQDAVYEV